MSLKIESSISPENLNKGQTLFQYLNQVDLVSKRAIITYRSRKGDIPDDFDDIVDEADHQSTMKTIAWLNIVRIPDEKFERILQEFKSSVGDLYSDGEAWGYLTVLEVNRQLGKGRGVLEGLVNEDGDRINEVAIDLVNVGEELSLVTCKFKLSTQIQETKEKLEQLHEWSDDISSGTRVGFGTLDLNFAETIEEDLEGDIDFQINGRQILDLE